VDAHDLDDGLHEVGAVAGDGGYLHTAREMLEQQNTPREDVGATEARDEVHERWLTSDTRVCRAVPGQLRWRQFLGRRRQ
jgi:hypothetical protein